MHHTEVSIVGRWGIEQVSLLLICNNGQEVQNPFDIC